jgi:hypothetical protein
MPLWVPYAMLSLACFLIAPFHGRHILVGWTLLIMGWAAFGATALLGFTNMGGVDGMG